MTSEITFTKGHGTENDFVLVADADGAWNPAADVVAWLCDRRAGLGADGLVRAVRTAAEPAAAQWAGEAEWFMDYRNADGSVAEMCGNGVRVFAEFLLQQGLLPEAAAAGEWFPVATRAGVKRLRREGEGAWTADMGTWRMTGGQRALAAGSDALVHVEGLDGVARPALSFDLGNPHTVVALPDRTELAAADLTRAPASNRCRRRAPTSSSSCPSTPSTSTVTGTRTWATCPCASTSGGRGRRVRAAPGPAPRRSRRARGPVRAPPPCGGSGCPAAGSS